VTAAATGAPRWLQRLHESPGATGRLLVFPAAGAHASTAHSMAAAAPAGWVVWSVQYPGRGPRLREAPAGSVRDITAACLPALLADPVPPAGRTVLFGHSFGAIVAYDLARLMEASGHPAAGLVVAGGSAPGPSPDAAVPGLPDPGSDADLVAFLGRRGGTAAHLLADEELMALAVAALRIDLSLARAYTDEQPGRLSTAILAVGGRSDRAVTATQLTTWRTRTDRWLGLELVDGGHFFHQERPDFLGRVLHRFLSVPE
jgi:surfactin synthase thioesterase subunit